MLDAALPFGFLYLLLVGALACAALAAQAPPLPDKAEPYPVVADIAFAEGPIFDQQGNLYFVNYHTLGTLGRRTPDGTVSVWVHTGGQANGLKVDRLGNIIVADYGGKRILRVHPITRQIEVLTSEYEGKPYLGTNDVCLDLAGNIYFSDPTGSSKDDPIGSVYRIRMSADNSVAKVTRLADGLAFPNGLAVSPDQKRLYVAESDTNRLLCWDLQPDGSVTGKRTIIQFPTDTLDGIMFDEYGRLWIARWTNKTVDVVDVEKGELLKSYPVGGDQVTNLCWRDTSLYVTVAG
ncbi:MAG: SMP-30/gluconolactonase/LRE family protein, partial [Armatimonadetes bacterium]|nr:SMP-30/gluconolactonase/LRE family protein [Armatimonadota bacterium]